MSEQKIGSERTVKMNNDWVVDRSTELHSKLVEEAAKVYPDEKDARSRWVLIGRAYNFAFARFYSISIKTADEALKREDTQSIKD